MKRTAATLFVTALLALLALPLSALPPLCDEICTCSSLCTRLCGIGSIVTNCGTYGVCKGECFAAQSAAPGANSPGQLLDKLFAPTEPVSSPAQPECASAL